MKPKKTRASQKRIFEKVIDNEYAISFWTELFIPLLTVFVGVLFGISVHYEEAIVSYLCIVALFFLAIIYVLGLIVWLEGRKVYWREVK